MSIARYAIYFAPAPNSSLWTFGSAVLGYDAYTGRAVEQFVPAGVSPDRWHQLTAEPRRYGFHATLKAPFRLADGAQESALLAAVEAFATSATPLGLTLGIERLGSFIALVPAVPAEGVAALERAVVTHFEPYRAPLNEAEAARRERQPLSQRQRELLEAYGYPYVLDEFRFHMSLTGPLPVETIAVAMQSLNEAALASVEVPIAVDRLALFRENDGQFKVLHAFPLQDRAESKLL